MSVRTIKPKPKVIDRLRVEKGMTLERLAREAKVSERSVGYIMAGKDATVEVMRRIAKALEVDVSAIAVGVAPPPEAQTFPVNLYFDKPLSEADHEWFMSMVRLLANRLGGDILDADITEGSVVITVQLTAEQIQKLIEMIPLAIRPDIERGDDPPGFVIGLLNPPELVTEGVKSIAFPDATFVPADLRGKTVHFKKFDPPDFSVLNP